MTTGKDRLRSAVIWFRIRVVRKGKQMDTSRRLLDLRDEELDEGQQRMVNAAMALFAIPSVYAKLHEFDDECQPDEAKRM